MSASKTILLLVSLALASASHAGFFQDYLIDPEDGMLDGSRYLSEVPQGFLPVPVIITEPAVGYGFGLAGVFFNESEEQKKQRLSLIQETGKAILPSNITVAGLAATENGTKGAGLGHLGFWKQDTLRYRGFLVLPDANLDFYSIGSFELPKGIEFNLKGPAVINELTARIPGTNFFAGAQQVYRKVDLSLTNADNLAPFDSPDLNNRFQDFLDEHAQADVVTSALGAVFEYDSRDNPFNPESGYNISGRYQWFNESVGSDIEFDSFTTQALGYWHLPASLLLGLRAEYEGLNQQGDGWLPPYVYPFVSLRGAPAVQYQGNRVATVEAELDWKIDNRWKVGVFAGTGRTADSFADLNDADNINTYGTGFRYLIARRYGFMMGIDIARGPDDTAFYIQAGSTWR